MVIALSKWLPSNPILSVSNLCFCGALVFRCLCQRSSEEDGRYEHLPHRPQDSRRQLAGGFALTPTGFGRDDASKGLGVRDGAVPGSVLGPGKRQKHQTCSWCGGTSKEVWGRERRWEVRGWKSPCSWEAGPKRASAREHLQQGQRGGAWEEAASGERCFASLSVSNVNEFS